MTRFSAKETSLLDISGEITEKTRLELNAYLARHPELRAQHREIQQQFNALHAMGRDELLSALSSGEKRAISRKIKAELHQLLGEQERAARQRARWRFAYHAAIGAAALAACLAVAAVAGFGVHRGHVLRQDTVAQAEESMRDSFDAGASNPTDVEYQDLASQIQAGNRRLHLVASESAHSAMQRLVDEPNEPAVQDPDHIDMGQI